MRQSVRSTLALFTCLLVVALPHAGLADAPTDEQAFVDLINQERRETGAVTLVVNDQLVAAARSQSELMADAGRIFHTEDLASVIDGWAKLGENVGMGGDIPSLHDAFMGSDGHRNNLLDPKYDQIGVGVVWRDGVPYVTEIFMDSAASVSLQFSPPFSDDDDSVHEDDIRSLWELGITRGCDESRYCPDRPVTRAELATLLVRAFDIDGGSSGSFTDTADSIHRSAIDALAAAGITKGCAPDLFCPDAEVSRAELASFFARMLELPSAGPAGFTDTVGSVHAGAIDSLAASGLTRGCGPDLYCPHDPVTRGQLASFLIRALSG